MTNNSNSDICPRCESTEVDFGCQPNGKGFYMCNACGFQWEVSENPNCAKTDRGLLTIDLGLLLESLGVPEFKFEDVQVSEMWGRKVLKITAAGLPTELRIPDDGSLPEAHLVFMAERHTKFSHIEQV